MENVAVNLVIVLIISMFTKFFVPPGKMEKIMSVVINLFVVSYAVYELIGIKNKIYDYVNMPSAFNNESKIISNINNTAQNFSKENIKVIVEGILADMGVIPKKTEIFMDITPDNSIVMIKSTIYIDNCSYELKDKIKCEVEKKLNIKVEVV